MKTAFLSALTASALVTSLTSPTFAQSTPAEAADLDAAKSAMAARPIAPNSNGPIVAPRSARIVAPAIVSTPAVVGTRPYDSLISSHAASNGLPAEIVHRVIVRESRYRADAMGRGGTSGLMQIKLATARRMGYTGTAAGLLDPDTNLTYGVRYLAGAYRAANGHAGRAVGYYASGYHHASGRRAPVNSYARVLPAPARISADAGADPVVGMQPEVRRKHGRR